MAQILRQNPDPAIEAALYAGAVGQDNAAEFVGFKRLWQQLPSLDEILRHPDTAQVSDDPAVSYAVASGLARKATAKNFKAIVAYVQRFPQPEWNIACVKDATRRDPALMDTEAFGRWTAQHADALN